MNEWLDPLVRATQESVAAEAMPFLTTNHTSTPESQVRKFFRDGLILPESVATQESPITILTMTASYMTPEEVIGQSITRGQIDFVLASIHRGGDVEDRIDQNFRDWNIFGSTFGDCLTRGRAESHFQQSL